MSEAGGIGEGAAGKGSLARAVFTDMAGEDPAFKELRNLLMHGRRSEAINLICNNDKRFDNHEAQELVRLIMNTLRDTMIDS